ncbi:unnamed protein product [Brassicogethes aeneus]|uniref:RING-type domain-containing protein n=1 Tax=Brassicogethes aeneus TaxID=1431903 RepID=A0A9P0FAT5_BRAAE|nr:unnamed protein product [Brassicogethes aeneus]
MAAADRETAAEAGADVAKRPVATTTEQGCQMQQQEKIKLTEINSYITCFLCKGYLIDATTISECLHSFCRSCIIEFLQENSHCPVCEVIINKAKPNLKLDKTLQDIVYKLVPQLFLNEMTRRKKFYFAHPEVAAKASPEDRGEDIERTIFNPQDVISLSIEYISDDSTPGAIRLPTANPINNNNNEESKSTKMDLDENAESQMKRYLQCPGMCRVEVLKKFVRNKYSVDTSKFHIDILYKRVPLPDHYTLIDIAYIYSWKRNEPMTFYFRITDINRVSERFDYFDIEKCKTMTTQIPTPITKCRNVPKSAKKSSKIALSSQNGKPEVVGTNKSSTKPEVVKSNVEKTEVVKKLEFVKQNIVVNKVSANKKPEVITTTAKQEVVLKNASKPEIEGKNKNNVFNRKPEVITKTLNPEVVKNASKPEIVANNTNKNNAVVQVKKPTPEVVVADKKPTQEVKKNVYTNITLNRTNNVEIITKIQKVSSNKDGHPVVLNILKQTVKKPPLLLVAANENGVVNLVKDGDNKKTGSADKSGQKQSIISDIKKTENSADNNAQRQLIIDVDEEKVKFLQNIELTAKSAQAEVKKSQPKVKISQPEEVKIPEFAKILTNIVTTSKRKNCSPVKNEKNKKLKPNTAKIILQSKPLHNFLGDCKINIPSSLSITLKDASGTENNQLPVVAPPVKNFIEILKIPEEKPAVKNVEDSDQKIDEDISKIALSLTEKIPLSTTVSQNFGPKNNFQIPVKKYPALPAPIPEVNSCKQTDPKTNPRNSPQSFQKIFEESVKKAAQPEVPAPIELPGTELHNVATQKRNISDIVSDLCKKSRTQEENEQKNTTSESAVAKVAIPRLPNCRKPSIVAKQPCKKVTNIDNLHSNTLNLSYSVSVDKKPRLEEKICPKSPGELSIVLPPEIPDVLKAEVMVKTPVNVVLPKNSPKRNASPKSSPVVKHMYSTIPSIKIPSPKVITPKLTPIKPKINSPKQQNSSPKHLKISPKISPKQPPQPLTPNQILEKYNIQNLAQLSATIANPQLAALQHAMLLKHFEMQNRQNWLNNMNAQQQQQLQQQAAAAAANVQQQFLQTLNANAAPKNQLLNNVKEN